jgi:hypothetical protein
MANPERGEVDLEVRGKRYRMALGMGGLRAIQRAVSTPAHRVTLIDVVTGASTGDIEYLCVLIWGALQRHHPELTQADVDQMLDDLGGLQALQFVLAKINEMMEATNPDVRDQGVVKKTAAPIPMTDARPVTPPPTPAGISTTGTRSISRRAKSA